MVPPSSLAFPLLEGHACWSMCGRRTRPFLGRAFREHIDQHAYSSNPFYLLLSSSTQSGKHPHRRAARWLLHCACRTSIVSSCAFHEQGEPLAALTIFSARPSTPSPPSLYAAHRPWLVQAP